eukprot:sb/3474807/
MATKQLLFFLFLIQALYNSSQAQFKDKCFIRGKSLPLVRDKGSEVGHGERWKGRNCIRHRSILSPYLQIYGLHERPILIRSHKLTPKLSGASASRRPHLSALKWGIVPPYSTEGEHIKLAATVTVPLREWEIL